MHQNLTSPEQLSAQQYADALQQLADRITQKQWEMLHSHYRAPNRSVTARQLAKAVGYPNYGSVNLQYGRLGAMLGAELGFEELKSSMVATFIKPDEGDNSEWIWTLLPALARALEQIGRVEATEAGFEVAQVGEQIRLGRDLSLEELGYMADKLSWVIPNVFIMPPHQYVVESKLKTQEEREAFALLCDSCAHHPNRWKAFFRAYKTKNSYMEIGDYRYWYSQIGAARMMNRSYRESEVENIRGAIGDRAVKNWSGCTYAWKREYGLECQNLHRYCNLILVEENSSGSDFSIVRYAAMVTRNAVTSWLAGRRNREADGSIETSIRSHLNGVEAIAGIKPAYSAHVSCSDEEISLKAVWMKHKDMTPSKVATDLRWFSTAPRLEIEMVAPLQANRNYLIQLNVPPA